MTSPLRSFVPVLLGAALFVATASATAVAQPPPGDPPAEESGGGGSAFHGYFASGVLAGMAMFAIARTARR